MVMSNRLTKTFALLCILVNVHLSTDDVSEWLEETVQFLVTVVGWKVVDEEVAPLRSSTAFFVRRRNRGLYSKRICVCVHSILSSL